MEIGASPLFRGISVESQQAMRTCFDMREVSFRADEVVYDFGAGRNMVGVLAEGAAVIERIDQQGNRTILERLYGNSVTGLVAALYDGHSISDRDLAELRRFLEEKEASHE